MKSAEPGRAALPRLGPALAVALAAAVAVAPRPAPAQESGGAQGDRPGWLGVGLQETLVCPRGGGSEAPEPVTPEDCRRAYVAEALVEDGPAHEAGVRPGDTLIAVNGRPLASRRGARALRSLDPGRPVEVLVGRAGGRESLRVTPAPRPPEMGRLTLRTPRSSQAGTLGVSSGVVFRWSRALEGVEAPPGRRTRGDEGALRVDRQGRVYLQGDGELVRLRGVEADHLRALRDSVMRAVRQRLRRLRREGSASAGSPALPSAGGPTLLRAAGAEFRPLDAELSEHFEGADRGLLVLRVLPGTPAHGIGLRPGDVVVEAAGRPTVRPGQLRAALRELSERDSVVVRWIRRGEASAGVLRRP